MKLRLQSGSIRSGATIDLPVSKSVINRLLILQYLSGNRLTLPPGDLPNDVLLLYNLLTSEDGNRQAEDAGTVMRFGAAALAVSEGHYHLSGTSRMHERPVGALIDALNELGADIRYSGKKGFPPLDIFGKKLKGGVAPIDAGISSQFLSAVLMVAPMAENPVELHWQGSVVSKPYLRLTLDMMRTFGAQVTEGAQSITIQPSGYRPASLRWENDWSSAAFFYSLCALNTGMECQLNGLKKTDLQGDREVMALFHQIGVESEFIESGLRIRHTGRNNSGNMEIDFTDIPDLVQPFVMCCAALEIPLNLKGLYNLHLKETDRLEALAWNVGQLGGEFRVSGTTARLLPNMNLKGVKSFRVFGDHRMAMSLAPLVSILKEIELNEAESVKKSYPGFWTELQKTGISVTEIK